MRLSVRYRLAAASARIAAALALAITLAAGASAARAQTLAELPINAQTALFCTDNTGTPVLQTYFNLGDVMRRYQQRFRFEMSVEPGEPGEPLKVVFSKPDESPYSITYSVQPYRDSAGRTGILLLNMHLFLDNADRDVTGTPMCYFTQFGK